MSKLEPRTVCDTETSLAGDITRLTDGVESWCGIILSGDPVRFCPMARPFRSQLGPLLVLLRRVHLVIVGNI